MASISALSVDCLSLICHYCDYETVKLIYSGDRRLQARLRPLRSLEVRLGYFGGYVSFEPLYALLGYFSSLKKLSVESHYENQLWIKKLKPERLPSSLESLRLDFWRAIALYLNRPSLYASLPNLRCLELNQPRHISTRTAYGSDYLSFALIPSSLRELRLANAINQFFTTAQDLEHLPSALEVFQFDGEVYGDKLRSGIQLDFRRFHSLHTLAIRLDRFAETSALTYPSTLTDLDIEADAGFNLEDSSFSWHLAFPSLSKLSLLSGSFKWRWLLDMPFSVRSIQARFEPFYGLSAADQQDIVSTLAARNDNFASLKTKYRPERMVPSQVHHVVSYTFDSPPEPISALFTGAHGLDMGYGSETPDAKAYEASDELKGTIIPERSLTFINDHLAFPNLRELIFTDTSPHGVQFGTDPITRKPRKFASSLTDFSWHVMEAPLTATLLQHLIPLQLAYVLRTLTCTLADDVHDRFHLSRFSQLHTVEIFRRGFQDDTAQMTSSRLSDLLPPSVAILKIDQLNFDAPLTLPTLEMLTVTQPIDLTALTLLPLQLQILFAALEAPIDVSNKNHCDALLSLPRGLRRLRIERSPTMAESIGLKSVDGMGIVFTKQTINNSLSKRVSDQCLALELLTRNLKRLIELDFPVISLPSDESLIQPQSVQAYLFLRIPFLNVISSQPDLLGIRSKSAACIPHARRMISALAPTSISAVNFIPDNASMAHQFKFDEMFMESKGLVRTRFQDNSKCLKKDIAAEKTLFWSAVLAYHVFTIFIYGFVAWLYGRDTYIHRFASGNFHLDFTGVTRDLSTWVPSCVIAASDLSLISSLLGLPLAIGRLRREKFSDWKFKTLSAPHHRVASYSLMFGIMACSSILATYLPDLWMPLFVALAEIGVFLITECVTDPSASF